MYFLVLFQKIKTDSHLELSTPTLENVSWLLFLWPFHVLFHTFAEDYKQSSWHCTQKYFQWQPTAEKKKKFISFDKKYTEKAKELQPILIVISSSSNRWIKQITGLSVCSFGVFSKQIIHSCGRGDFVRETFSDGCLYINLLSSLSDVTHSRCSWVNYMFTCWKLTLTSSESTTSQINLLMHLFYLVDTESKVYFTSTLSKSYTTIFK